MREGWKEVRLGDILEIKHGYGFKGEFFKEDETDNVLVTPGNFNIGGGFKNEKLKFYDGPISDDFVLKANDVIVTMTDLSKMADTIGYSAKVPSSSKTYLHNQRIGLIKLLTDEVDIDFIYWFLRTSNYQRYIAGSSTGATVKHTSPSKIYSYKGLIPPLETQKKIASILSGYDDLIENNLKRIKILEEMAQQTYEEWFVRMRFPGHDASRASASVNPETGLPEGWEKVKLGDEFIIKNGKSFKGVNTDNPYDNKIYGSNGIIGYTNFSNTRNSVIIGRVGAYCGSINYCSQDYWATDNTIYVEEKSNGISIELAYFILKKLNLRTFAGGAAQPLLTQNTINQLEILKPSKDLIFEFSKMCKNINKQILNLTNQNQRLREARDILLPRLMMGMIEV